MTRWLAIAAVACLIVAAPVWAADVTGKYVEARTCDVWTGPCFANADMNLGGKNAVMAWKVDKGTFDKVSLNGLSVVAVISARDTLGLEQTGPGQAVQQPRGTPVPCPGSVPNLGDRNGFQEPPAAGVGPGQPAPVAQAIPPERFDLEHGLLG